MKKFFPVTYVILFLVFSCEHADIQNEEVKSKEVCSVDNPIEELEWLQNKIQEIEQSSWAKHSYVQQTEFHGSTVFIFGLCCAFCNMTFPVYNCEGEKICDLGGDCDGLILDPNNIIWQAPDYECLE